MVVRFFETRGGMWPPRPRDMVVGAVVSCLGVGIEVGMIVRGYGSGDWLKRWVFDEIRPIIVA